MAIGTRATEPGPGFKIGEYVIERELGHGSMATVYLARDDSGHEVAVKIFTEGSGVSATMLERFRREAEATKRLRRHPYILTVYGAGQQGAYHYIAMEFIAGSRTLEDVVDEDEPSLERVLQMINRIATALDYAHEHEIVHRDVKPANIMVDTFGEPLLADFGVCDLVDWPGCTVSGALTGTPLYMSPEQARAEKVDQRSDIYSLGVVMYEALCGELPFELTRGPVTNDVLEAVKTQHPQSPRTLNRRISRDLEFVMLRALEKDAKNRYPSAKAFAQDIECVIEGWPVRSNTFSRFYKLRHFVRRHIALLVVLVLVAIAGGVAVNVYQGIIAESHVDKMLILARNRAVEFQLEEKRQNAGEQTGQLNVAEEIRKARQQMAQGKVFEARNRLQEAASISSVVYQDERGAAEARLEEARCELLLDNSTRGQELYQLILKTEGASPAVAALAAFELIGTLSLREEFPKVKAALLENNSRLQVGPFSRSVQCIAGTLEPEALSKEILALPEGFQNDAFWALGIRYYLNEDSGKARQAFETCVKASDPKVDWPGPLAAHYLKRLEF